MEIDKGLPAGSLELRCLAEERLRTDSNVDEPSLPNEESQRLIHELHVHQIELEMQNDELRQARDERQKMEALLGKYSDLYDFAPVGYFNLDQIGIIRAVNLTGTGFLGVERSLLINRSFDLFISDETRPVFHDFLDRVFASETRETCEVVFQHKGRSPLFVQVEAVLSDSREECRAVVIDITERKRSEETQARLAALVESSDDAIIAKTLNGNILSWNPGSERLFGYQVDEVLGKPINLIIPPELLEEEEKILLRLAAGERIEHFDTVRMDKYGRRVDVSVTASPIIDTQGRIIGASKIVRDITRRKLVEEAQRRAKEEWERTFDSVPDLIAVLDNQCRVLRVNDAMARRLGFKPEDCVGLHCYEAFHGTSGPPEFCPHARTIKDDCQHIEELYVDRFGGDFLVTTTPLLDEKREYIGSVHIAHDITERKRMEDALRKSEERYRMLFETMTEGFALHEIITDEQGRPYDYRFLDVNPAFELLTGLKRVDLVGNRVREVMPGVESYWIENYGKVALTGETLHMENYSAALNRWYDVFAYQTSASRFAVVITDITERKLAEELLKKLNEELENRVKERTTELAATIENLQFENVARKNAEEHSLRLNRLYAVLSKINESIVRTKDRDTLFHDFCRIAVEDGGFMLAWVGLVDEESGELKMAAANGATGYLEDIRITTNEEPAGLGPTGISVREGTDFICNDFLGSPITLPWHDRGRVHGIRASASIALKQEERVIGALTLYADKKDFFDQQQVELLRQMGTDVSFALDNFIRESRRQEAEQALREETVERLLAVENLREKEQLLIQQSRLAAMGEMIGNIAHQWRQPLNALGLNIQQMSMFYEFGELTKKLMDQSVSSSMKLIQHMSKTIDDFRDYFRPDKEKVEFKVCEVIENTLTLIEDSFKSQHINIEVSAKNDPAIVGYRNEFAQVLLNILNNARDILMERDIDDPRVTITIFGENDRVVVTISDNAGGIPEEILDKIFDPYFTTKGPQAGTGVGLFMSKTIIEKNMGGSLAARNITNGAEFRVEV